jgi:hypothetical protein
MRINDLKPFVDKTVKIRMRDGEIATVKVSLVDEEDRIAAVQETSHPEHYRAPRAMHTFAVDDIVSVELSK